MGNASRDAGLTAKKSARRFKIPFFFMLLAFFSSWTFLQITDHRVYDAIFDLGGGFASSTDRQGVLDAPAVLNMLNNITSGLTAGIERAETTTGTIPLGNDVSSPVARGNTTFASLLLEPTSFAKNESAILAKRNTRNQPLFLSSRWPTKTPRDLFGSKSFEQCKVVFRDSSTATCHLGAFGGNFGDMLGPDIVKRIVEYRFGCSAETLPVVDFETQSHPHGSCLWTVGSVWRHVRKNDHVWGTGSFGTRMDYRREACMGGFKNITIYSLRGPKTVRKIIDGCPQVQVSVDNGDSIMTKLTPSTNNSSGTTTKKTFFESCIILHKYDQDTFTKAESLGEAHTLLPVIQSWRTMAENISRCKVVSSSSLHGLILADAYGIPSRWVRRDSSVLPFKFRDYFDSIGGPSKNQSDFTLKQVVKDPSRPEPLDPKRRFGYARKVIQSFPYHLFTIVDETVSL